MRFFLILLLLPFTALPQSKVSGLIIDKDTGEPLEFVDVFNEKNSTTSNSEGRFELETNDSLINFNLLGYEKETFLIEELTTDTIYLKNKFFELKEIIISDVEQPIKSVFKKILVNYPLEPYSETFFMRCVLKKDEEIIKLQDLSGLIRRQTLFSTSKSPMPKNNYVIEIQHMRKAGIKENEIEFEMFSFNEFFQAIISLYMSPELYDYRVTAFQDKEFMKYNFTPKKDSKLASKGYYLVNLTDNAFNEYYMVNQEENKSFTEKGNIKYRTVFYELDVKFKKNPQDSKYYLNIAKLTAKVEVMNKEKKSDFYTAEYQWLAGNPGNYEVVDNTSLNKDLFKLNKRYDASFWQHQSLLPLTKEMTEFLKKLVSETDSEYKTISNLPN